VGIFTKIKLLYAHCAGKLASWQAGKLASWQAGKLASWQAGKLASWQAGKLASWPLVSVTDFSVKIKFYSSSKTVNFNRFLIIPNLIPSTATRRWRSNLAPLTAL
jgi:hypothetical protein